MKKILTNQSEASKAGYIRAGAVRYFIVKETGEKLFLPVFHYGLQVDLGTLEQCTWDETRPGLPTVSDLVKDGTLVEATVYKMHDVDLSQFRSCRSRQPAFTGKIVRGIIAEFKEKGFSVTREAIMHNFVAWYAYLKSGYRDDINGYFLFTPCGCNSLSFRATTLDSDLDDWQKTYEC